MFNIEHVGSKHSIHNASSTYLWHQMLGHVSKQKVARLQKGEKLPQLIFGDSDICLDCIKGKHTKQISNNMYTRRIELLELIHIGIYGSFDIPFWGGEKYFITSIDDSSCYCYLYLLHGKTQSINILMVQIDKVEIYLDIKLKIIRFNRGGEYYGKYNDK